VRPARLGRLRPARRAPPSASGAARPAEEQCPGHRQPRLRRGATDAMAAGGNPGGRARPRGPPPDPPDRRTGAGPLAGLILGWIGVGFAVLAVIGIVLAAVAFTRSSGGSTHVTPG